jgi:hypothetical protein
MTTIYSPMSKDDLVLQFLRRTPAQKRRARFPLIAAFHFCITASVAIYCLDLVR